MLGSCRKISNRNKNLKVNNNDYTLLLNSRIKKAYELLQASVLIQKLESVLLEGHLHSCVIEGVKSGREDQVLGELLELYSVSERT